MPTRLSLCFIALLTVPAFAQDDTSPRRPGGGTIVESTSGVREFDPQGDDTRSTTQKVLSDLHPDGRLWYQHVQTLSNPWFEGRQPGSRGGELTLNYIQWHMDQIGLEPAFDDGSIEPDNPWRQPFSFNHGRSLVLKRQSASVGRTSLTGGEDFNALAISGSGEVTAPVTFAGYAIEEGPDGYSSFGDRDSLKGRIAIMLRYEPLDEDGHSRWADEGGSFSPNAGIRSKFQSLIDRGVVGVVLVTPPDAVDGKHDLETVASTRGFGRALDMPVVQMTPEAANAMLRRGGKSFRSLIDKANRGEGATTRISDRVQLSLQTELERAKLETFNIGGVLPGTGELSDEWVIVGGHFDHLGYGYLGSRAPGVHAIHPGADDNASGTAAVLVLADRLHDWAQSHDDSRRNILFLGFGGEEAGLHGSRFFVNNPSIDLGTASAMVNLDMVGRLRDDRLMLGGTGTAEEFDELLPTHVEPSGLTVVASRGGTGPSDHASFFTGGVPVLFFFTGLHDDYHRPEDEGWTVDPEGGLRIIDLAQDVIVDIATRDDQLTFMGTQESGPVRRTGAKVRLGIMPAYGADLETGVQVESVTAGTSAALGGIQAGDVLLAWDDTELAGGRDLMAALRKHEAGDVVTIRVKRGDAIVPLTITLKGREE